MFEGNTGIRTEVWQILNLSNSFCGEKGTDTGKYALKQPCPPTSQEILSSIKQEERSSVWLSA